MTSARFIALFRAVLLLLSFTAIPSCHAFFFFRESCPQTDSCGPFQVRIHKGTLGADDCVEYCVFFLFLDSSSECGGCTETTDNAPLSVASSDVGLYDITLQLVDIPLADQSFFSLAAQRWENIVRGDLSDVDSAGLSGFGGDCVLPDTIDDLYICAVYSDIDGPGQVLGSAGPRYYRDNGLTTTGFMQFDAADIEYLKEKGNFDSVIVHEMGHILGTFGTTDLLVQNGAHF